ncbi:hypothetical protein LR004_02565 [Candidatus Gracilibacteria bacterium]|nr:hypothetical protein [Candidatus Gracilibacteria bacterium]
MKSKINKILQDIQNKREELSVEYSKLKEKYGFRVEGRKIIFNTEVKKKNKVFKTPVILTILSARLRDLLSIPFIYAMVIPTLFLDIFLFVYQQSAFRLYGIPLVSRKDYIIYDRKSLDYLNILQKFNCIYCSYVNGIFQFAVEVGGRTEQYWCPIKNARKKMGEHDWEEYFADYGSPEEFKKAFHSLKEFEKLKKETK